MMCIICKLAVVLGCLLVITSTILYADDANPKEIGAIWQNNIEKRFPRIVFGQLGAPLGQLTFVQQCTLPELPATIQVYKVENLVSKKDTVLKIIKALPIKATPEIEDQVRHIDRLPSSWGQKESSVNAYFGDWTIKVWSAGQFILNNTRINEQVPADFEKLPVAPTEEEARKTADNFLNNIGYLPSVVKFLETKPGRSIERGWSGKPEDTKLISLIVSYTGFIDGIPVVGPVGIEISSGSKILTVNNRLRKSVPDTKVPIITPKEAFKRLSEGEGYISNGAETKAIGIIDSVMLAYWQNSTAEDLQYIMPVYVFEGDATVDGKKVGRCKAYIEAVKPEFLESAKPFTNINAN